WARAVVPSFEVSLIVPGATVVQPGPPATGGSGMYSTGQATWQGGRTCLRSNGAGTCDISVPYGVATGAACIQWNQRGQCTGYVPAEGASIVSPRAPGAGPTGGAAAAGAPRVPTVVASGPPVGNVRAVAPP